METVTRLAAGAIILLFSVTAVFCDDLGDFPRIWQNQGGGVRNLRVAPNEKKISKASVNSLSLSWTAPTGYDVSSTPSIDGIIGAVYFSSWDGCQYAVQKNTGQIIWKVNLTDIAPTIPGLLQGIVVIPYFKSIAGPSPSSNLANLLSRSTPTIAGPLLIFGIFNPCFVLALNRFTGAVVWWKELDSTPFCALTQSGTYFEGSFYIGTSSQEELGPSQTCCIFQGAFFKLDALTGTILWRTPMLPSNNQLAGLYAGAAIWGSSPSIDVVRRLVFIGTGNTYSVPPAVDACQKAVLNSTSVIYPDPCIQPDDHSESILAISIDTGRIVWATHLGGYDVWTLVCASSPVKLPNCPSTVGPDYDFGEAPLLLTIKGSGPFFWQSRDIVVVGQKSGVIHALDRATGGIIWQTPAGPGGNGGGASWGMTTDGQTVFTSIINSNGNNFTLLPSSRVITWGGWVALSAATGQILWSTANPAPFGTQPPVAYANGVVFGGSAGSIGTGTPSGQIVALDALTGAVLWTYTTQGGISGGVSIMDGCIFQPVGLSIVQLGFTPSPSIHGHSTISLCVP